MVVSLALIAAGVAIAVESISEIRTPHRLPAPYTLAVLIAVVAIKLLLARYVGEVRTDIDSTAVKADFWHHLSDAITSGLAFIGISIGLATNNSTADDWAALCASPIILFNGIRQLRSPVEELLDTSPSSSLDQEVRRAASTVPGVGGLEKCFIRKVGFKYYVDLHVLVDGRVSVTDGHRIAHEVQGANSCLAAQDCQSAYSHRTHTRNSLLGASKSPKWKMRSKPCTCLSTPFADVRVQNSHLAR